MEYRFLGPPRPFRKRHGSGIPSSGDLHAPFSFTQTGQSLSLLSFITLGLRGSDAPFLFWESAEASSLAKDDSFQNKRLELQGLPVNPSFSGLFLLLDQSKTTILSFTSILELYTPE